jgi:hypothetical protein
MIVPPWSSSQHLVKQIIPLNSEKTHFSTAFYMRENIPSSEFCPNNSGSGCPSTTMEYICSPSPWRSQMFASAPESQYVQRFSYDFNSISCFIKHIFWVGYIPFIKKDFLYLTIILRYLWEEMIVKLCGSEVEFNNAATKYKDYLH